MEQKTTYDELDDRLVVKTTYDNSEVLDDNKTARAAFSNYKREGSLVHVGSLHEGDVVRLKNLGYDLLSPDPEEWKRALLYIQRNEPHLLTVNGTPFSQKKTQWV